MGGRASLYSPVRPSCFAAVWVRSLLLWCSRGIHAFFEPLVPVVSDERLIGVFYRFLCHCSVSFHALQLASGQKGASRFRCGGLATSDALNRAGFAGGSNF